MTKKNKKESPAQVSLNPPTSANSNPSGYPQSPNAANADKTVDGRSSKASNDTNGPKSSAVSRLQERLFARSSFWKFVEHFGGPWFTMPLDSIEAIAHINYNAPGPRPIAPSVFFDLSKIRHLVEEATTLAVKASCDVVPKSMPNANYLVDSFFGSKRRVPTVKLSKERKFRIREQASQKLSLAYRLDDAACIAALKGDSLVLEELTGLALQRNPQDLDAKYAHFFHERTTIQDVKLPKTLSSLDEIISERSNEAEVLRTRAVVKCYNDDLEGALYDLSLALSTYRFHGSSHNAIEEEPSRPGPQRYRFRPQDTILAPRDQPSSLEGQLLFLRATVYLSIAYKYVWEGLPPDGDTSESVSADQAEARKQVKLYAKRALREFLKFIEPLEYSPNLPAQLSWDFSERVTMIISGRRPPRNFEGAKPAEKHDVYSFSDLFSAVPPSGLPPLFIEEGVQECPNKTTIEMATYHPLAQDALHSILLCHCLMQTSQKELKRHIYMVARLIRQADGFPLFSPHRASNEATWLDVVNAMADTLDLGASWHDLCSPLPITFVPAQNPFSKIPAEQLSAYFPICQSAKCTANDHDPYCHCFCSCQAPKAGADEGEGENKNKACGPAPANNAGGPLPTADRHATKNKVNRGIKEFTPSADLTAWLNKYTSNPVLAWVRKAPVVTGAATTRRKKKTTTTMKKKKAEGVGKEATAESAAGEQGEA